MVFDHRTVICACVLVYKDVYTAHLKHLIDSAVEELVILRFLGFVKA
jgi:hypothetical protein